MNTFGLLQKTKDKYIYKKIIYGVKKMKKQH